MESAKSSSDKSEIKTVKQGEVEKITLPYLDWRINPNHLEFSEDQPSKSKLKEDHVNDEHDIQKSQPNLRIYQEIGKGTFGAIVLAQNKDTGEWIAIKLPHNMYTNLNEEIKEIKLSGNFIFHDEETNAIGMKLLEGSELYKTMVKEDNEEHVSPQHFSNSQRLVIAKNILTEIAGIHKDVEFIKGNRNDKLSILHRDIKSQNLIFDASSLKVKYCDYGAAEKLNPSSSKFQSLFTKKEMKPTLGQKKDLATVGSPLYLAPELVRAHRRGKQKVYNEATEVYALGMTIAEVFGVAESYWEDWGKDRGMWRYKIVEKPDVPNEITDLIKRMVHDNADKRPTVIEARIEFNKLFDAEAKKSKLRTCVISIDEFLAMEPENKQALIQSIIKNEINAVALQGSADTTNQKFYQVRYELMNAGIISIAPFMVKGANQDHALRVVKDHYDHTLASTNTEVYIYQKGAMVRQTITTPSLPVIETSQPVVIEKTNLSEDQINEIKQLLQFLHDRISAGAALLANHKQEKSMLTNMLNADFSSERDLLPFISKLEQAYLKSLESHKSLLHGRPTIDTINRNPDKYASCCVLGLALKHAYEEIQKLNIIKFKPRISDISNLHVEGSKFAKLDVSTTTQKSKVDYST